MFHCYVHNWSSQDGQCPACPMTDLSTSTGADYAITLEDKQMTEEQEFRVGDKVSWLGLPGQVISIESKELSNYPVVCLFADIEVHFTQDGTHLHGQYATLQFISRAKKKLVEYRQAVLSNGDLNPTLSNFNLYCSLEQARSAYGDRVIGMGPVVFSREEEVEL